MIPKLIQKNQQKEVSLTYTIKRIYGLNVWNVTSNMRLMIVLENEYSNKLHNLWTVPKKNTNIV